MKKLFHSKSKIHSDNVETDLQVKEFLKQLEDTVINPLGKLIRTSTALLQNEAKRVKDYEGIGLTLEKLSSTSLVRGENKDAHFVEAFKLFSESLKNIASYNQIYVNESNDKYITPTNTFFKIELTDHLKVLRKQYEKARDDYSAALLKRDNYLHANKKKIDIEKLYALEKDKVRLRKIYEISILDLKEFCEDIYERINFDLLDFINTYFESKKKSLGLAYTDLDDIKARLDELNMWANEEMYTFTTHTTNREEQKTCRQRETTTAEIRAFVTEFDKALIDVIRPIGIRNDTHSQDIAPPLSVLFSFYEVKAPEGFSAEQPSNTSPENSLESVRLIVKNNIDAIGLALISNGMVESLHSLTETLAVLEKAAVQ